MLGKEKTNFGRKLKYLLIVNSLSNTEFAKIVGVRPNTVSQWVHGKREPSFACLVKIRKVLHTSYDFLLEHMGNK